MSQVAVTVNFSTAQLPPDTPEVALARVILLQGEVNVNSQQVPFANPLTLTFDVPPGSYTVRAMSLSASGSLVGDPLDSPLTVMAERPVPSSIS